ncbi:MAG: hypothetical protein ACFFBD_09290 [Candidatus Hodarchaeota archaeon]
MPFRATASVKLTYLGKKGVLTDLLKKLGRRFSFAIQMKLLKIF